MKTVMITGANRGIGLAFAKQYAEEGLQVLACCREPEKALDLKGLPGNVSIHGLDVTDPEQIRALGEELSEHAIDILINNAGVYGPRNMSFGQIDYGAWARVLAVNTMAPMRIAEAFCRHIARSDKKIMANITSKMGSIEDNSSGGSYLYRSSKSALNAVTKSMAVDLRPKGILCVTIHPGWVQTDMGGPGGLITAETSVRGMRTVLNNLTPDQSGGFFNYDGSIIPW